MTPLVSDAVWWLKKRWVSFVILLAAAVWGVALSIPRYSGVRIVFCDVGQGDATLIQRGFIQILIDGGRSGRVLTCLGRYLPFFDRTIEQVIVSHPQSDHFGGLADVLKRYQVMSFVYDGVAGSGEEWEQFSDLVKQEGAAIRVNRTGDQWSTGGMTFRVLWPRAGSVAGTSAGPAVLGVKAPEDSNTYSLVVKASYGAFDVLLTGDIGVEQEKEIGKEIKKNSIEVLKVPHHGSKYSSSKEFLEAVRPALAVIQVGKNSYGHPTKETIDRLEAVGARVLRNDRDGDILIETDGKRWKVRNEQK